MPKLDISISNQFLKTLEEDARVHGLPLDCYLARLLSSIYKVRDLVMDCPEAFIHTKPYMESQDDAFIQDAIVPFRRIPRTQKAIERAWNDVL